MAKHQFVTDKNFLFRYYVWNLAFLGIGIALMLGFGRSVFWWEVPILFLLVLDVWSTTVGICGLLLITFLFYPLHLWYIAPILAGIYVGHLSSMLMHNASHGNLRPRFLNRTIGEVCGFIQVYGFIGFQTVHYFHHIHPDDRLLDPHPPSEADSYFAYLTGVKHLIKRFMDRTWLETFGKSRSDHVWWQTQTGFFFLNQYGRLVFLYILLGPPLFATFFIPSFLANIYLYNKFNYFTHRTNPDGSVEILNLNDTLYEKLVNAMFAGILFHKNHHRRPYLYDPRHSDFA